MHGIEASWFLKDRLETALDKDKFMEFTIKEKLDRLDKLKEWVKNALETRMYPSEEVLKLKSLQNEIHEHIILLTTL